MTDTERDTFILPSLSGMKRVTFHEGRTLRPDLTPQELERLKEYGSIDYKSAGATRKR